MPKGFVKITPVNGFDITNPDNARQNNYAWSMEEMGDYIYVGTGELLHSLFQVLIPQEKLFLLNPLTLFGSTVMTSGRLLWEETPFCLRIPLQAKEIKVNMYLASEIFPMVTVGS